MCCSLNCFCVFFCCFLLQSLVMCSYVLLFLFSLFTCVVSFSNMFLIACRWNALFVFSSGSFSCSGSIPYTSFDLTTASKQIILNFTGQLLILRKMWSFCNVLDVRFFGIVLFYCLLSGLSCFLGIWLHPFSLLIFVFKVYVWMLFWS